jgi:hypothetical protein
VPLLSLRFFILLIGMLAAPTTLTIVETGRITGHVRDPKGGPVKGAIVDVIGTSLNTTTNDSGAYLFATVPVGTYTLRARRIGYSQTERANGRDPDGYRAEFVRLAETVRGIGLARKDGAH